MLAYDDASEGLGIARADNGSSFDKRQYYPNSRRRFRLNESKKLKSETCVRKTTQFLFSHIGLVGLVTIYAIAGGFLFQLIEEHQERIACQEANGDQIAAMTITRQKIIDYIKNNTSSLQSTYRDGKDNMTVAFSKIGSMLYEYRRLIIKSSSKYQYYSNNCDRTTQWTYANSLLFAITIITTIGYGNITPQTWEGRLCSICYATIGIPIFLLCLANLSGVLGEMFRFIYSKVICAPCTLIKKHRMRKNTHKLEETEINADVAASGDLALTDQNKSTTIKNPSSNTSVDNNLDEADKFGEQRVTVPLTVTMIIIALYIWIGSALFHNFEDWTMIQSGYFCFITLATIGFGDLVPGQRKDDANASAKLVLGAVYTLFGMAILAMCFDLMQEEIVAKFRWIGTKIGIVDKEDEYYNYQYKMSTAGKDVNRLSTSSSSNNSSNMRMDTARTFIDNENENNSVTRNPITPRKLSPRNNMVRVHPMKISENNEATLYQRVAISKLE